ncbi:hypothetical protein VZT92_007066 [Zoarces viviparus]|uniref:Uncharacterized protein n=1 Tax=Zoarces viviparus TaxID=48416 RepID=A0AAW1FKD2_ZOAVI
MGSAVTARRRGGFKYFRVPQVTLPIAGGPDEDMSLHSTLYSSGLEGFVTSSEEKGARDWTQPVSRV